VASSVVDPKAVDDGDHGVYAGSIRSIVAM
jgi:hypothetical protein